MPPKAKYTKEEIIEAAFQLVREKGEEGLTARAIAEKLSTSPRPIFTAFGGMDDLKADVVGKCTDLYIKYCDEERGSGKFPEYKALGMAYIKLAKCEKNVFKLLFMRDTSNEKYAEQSLFKMGTKSLNSQLNLNLNNAAKMHTEIWIWVHGIASLLATSYIELDFDTISNMLTDVYQGLKGRFTHE
jgi:AcrR family transcriptional regulator